MLFPSSIIQFLLVFSFVCCNDNMIYDKWNCSMQSIYSWKLANNHIFLGSWHGKCWLSKLMIYVVRNWADFWFSVVQLIYCNCTVLIANLEKAAQSSWSISLQVNFISMEGRSGAFIQWQKKFKLPSTPPLPPKPPNHQLPENLGHSPSLTLN